MDGVLFLSKILYKYTVYGRHFAGKMWVSAGMVMMNTKKFALQSSSPSHKVWRRKKDTPWLCKNTLAFAIALKPLCVGVLKKKEKNKETDSMKIKRPCFVLT